MILNLFRRTASQAIVERLYSEIVAASRRPAFFLPPFGVADTFEGRFEVLVLHALTVLRRLSDLPPPAPDLGQDITNRMFQGFDAAMREMGVGDLTVPKRMKTLAENFAGRGAAYARAFAGNESLEAALARNVYGRDDPAIAAPLAAWFRTADATIGTLPFGRFEAGALSFPPATEGTS